MGTGARFWALALFFSTIVILPKNLQAVTLSSASIAFTADDQAEIWINGNSLGYLTCGSVAATSCYAGVSTVSIPTAWFGPCNVIAAADFDFFGGQGFFSFDIT